MWRSISRKCCMVFDPDQFLGLPVARNTLGLAHLPTSFLGQSVLHNVPPCTKLEAIAAICPSVGDQYMVSVFPHNFLRTALDAAQVDALPRPSLDRVKIVRWPMGPATNQPMLLTSAP